MHTLQFAIIALMTPPDEKAMKVVRIFFGTRADLAPAPMTYLWDCQRCHAPTYSAAEPPPQHTLVCNVCVSRISEQAEQDPHMHTGWNTTDEGWDRLGAMAQERKRPIEEMFKHAMEWQVRRPITGAIYRKPEQKPKK
jgi:hypothetical protein